MHVDKKFLEYDIGYTNGLYVISAKSIDSDANSNVKIFSEKFFRTVKKAERKVIDDIKNPKATPTSTSVGAKNIGASPNLVDDSGCDDGDCDDSGGNRGGGGTGGGDTGGGAGGDDGGDPSGEGSGSGDISYCVAGPITVCVTGTKPPLVDPDDQPLQPPPVFSLCSIFGLYCSDGAPDPSSPGVPGRERAENQCLLNYNGSMTTCDNGYNQYGDRWRQQCKVDAGQALGDCLTHARENFIYP